MPGLKRLRSASITTPGVELTHRIRKGQFKLGELLVKGETAREIWNAVLAAGPAHAIHRQVAVIPNVCIGGSRLTLSRSGHSCSHIQRRIDHLEIFKSAAGFVAGEGAEVEATREQCLVNVDVFDIGQYQFHGSPADEPGPQDVATIGAGDFGRQARKPRRNERADSGYGGGGCEEPEQLFAAGMAGGADRGAPCDGVEPE